MSEVIKQFSFRIPEESLYALKKAAIERRTSPTELTKKVLSEWWQTQPEGKAGPLFPEEVESNAKAKAETPGKPSQAK